MLGMFCSLSEGFKVEVALETGTIVFSFELMTITILWAAKMNHAKMEYSLSQANQSPSKTQKSLIYAKHSSNTAAH